ncbi:hypothetical protein MetMK1DRAFT_00021420 [Metallosphaera yellowstonensis MK1]|uniref:Uncharacterized protein n=1 Tax=Metallosphaera yellowstonensis MK1 TaxID=671065 RepID=H2C6G4_9CREN|nr:hypothetical protein [Metallosphaera yellowstonensis]EHP69391.1 hypothetical protein MetMK1DRAFT_00021420 [Metallosphaera yellowstonensis MK1]
MPNVVITFLVIVVTLMMALGVFSLYTTYFSAQSITLQERETLVAQSKQLVTFVSPITFRGITPNYQYFNVSFLLWYSSPTKNVTLVPFVVNQLPGIGVYLYTPSVEENALIMTNSSGKLNVIRGFHLSSTVFTTQGQQLSVNAEAFPVGQSGTVMVNAKVSPGQIIVVWILTYEFGSWYRLGYFFVNPEDAGLGLYVTTATAPYLGNSKNTNFQPPHLFSNNQGVQLGLWFKVIDNATSPSNILYFTFNATNNKIYYIYIYQYGEKILVKTNASPNNPIPLANANVGAKYFINLSFGSQVKQDGISIYNSSGNLINYTTLGIGEANSYVASVKFGSPYQAVEISQAFLETLQNENGLGAFYNTSSTALRNGFYYNNTEPLYQIINGAKNNLHAIVYWYFVYPTSSPPPYVSATVWYWPNGNSSLNETYLYPSGPNTWTID